MKTLLLITAILGISLTTQADTLPWPTSVTIQLQEDERDGSSYEKAIIIQETNGSAGVAAEYKWLRKHYPGYKFMQQSLRDYKGKYYDVLLIKYNGKKKEVFFDISNFFGNY